MLIPGQKIPCQVQYDGFGPSAIFPELVSAQLFMFFCNLKLFWKDSSWALKESLLQQRQEHWCLWQRHHKMVSSNASESFTYVGKSTVYSRI
jgi:hypothetical protein